MASSQSTPKRTTAPNGVLLLTVARSASNLLVKSLVSGQDATTVESAEYNFGASIIAHHPKLVEHSFDGDDYTPEERKQIWRVIQTSSAKTLGLFVTAAAEVRSLLSASWFII